MVWAFAHFSLKQIQRLWHAPIALGVGFLDEGLIYLLVSVDVPAAFSGHRMLSIPCTTTTRAFVCTDTFVVVCEKLATVSFCLK